MIWLLTFTLSDQRRYFNSLYTGTTQVIEDLCRWDIFYMSGISIRPTDQEQLITNIFCKMDGGWLIFCFGGLLYCVTLLSSADHHYHNVDHNLQNFIIIIMILIIIDINQHLRPGPYQQSYLRHAPCMREVPITIILTI